MGVVRLAVVTGLMEAVGLAAPASMLAEPTTILGRNGTPPCSFNEASGSMNFKARSQLAY